MIARRMLAVAGSLTLLLGGAANAATGSQPLSAPPSWQVQFHDGVQISVRVQCSAEDTAAVAVHLVDPLNRGAMYTAVIDAGSSAMSAGPTSDLLESDPVYYFLSSGQSKGPTGTVTVAMTKSLGTDSTKNTALTFNRPAIDCTPQIS